MWRRSSLFFRGMKDFFKIASKLLNILAEFRAHKRIL